VQLPEDSDQRTEARIKRKCGNAAAAAAEFVEAIIVRLTALLQGRPIDLTDIALNMTGIGDLEQRVCDIARQIPAGATLTYGEIATRLGDRLLAREVGRALGRSPFPLIVPCHRVLAAGGKAGGFSASGGVNTKLRLLAIEGVHFAAAPSPPPKRPGGTQLGLFDGAP